MLIALVMIIFFIRTVATQIVRIPMTVYIMVKVFSADLIKMRAEFFVKRMIIGLMNIVIIAAVFII